VRKTGEIAVVGAQARSGPVTSSGQIVLAVAVARPAATWPHSDDTTRDAVDAYVAAS
jgi:hypothetical protein